MRKLLIATGVLAACAAAAGFSMQSGQTGQAGQAGQAVTGHAAANSVTKPIVRTATTIAGQPLRLPGGRAEMVASAVEIPAGGSTPIHQHPWSRFVYVERGPLRVVNHDTGKMRDFQTGDVFPEVVFQWHEGRAIAGPVRVIVIDVVPPGVNNSIMRK
jgi:quercetin dioxygenase-like cupin family protein